VLIPAACAAVLVVVRERLESERDELRHFALTDALTGVANRRALLTRIEYEVARHTRAQRSFAVLMLDLDGFKDLNDRFGHAAGDELLRDVAGALQSATRGQDTVARLGGDEFGIALAGLATPAEAEDVARKLTDALEAPFQLDGIDIALGGSIGIAAYPDHGDQPDQLLRRAEVAMYVAKAARAPFELYAPAQDTYSTDRLALVADLRKAIDEGALTVAYQPMIDLSRGAIVGVEALLRWTHPTQGPIGPDTFIPLAEHSGLIGRITTFVLEAATSQARAWQDAGLELTVSVNLSVRDLQHPGLAATVAETLRANGLSPRRIRLEITEGSVMDQPDRALATLKELAAVGVSLSVDDFGTGYSSLAYLQRLPVDELKIDRSFVLGLAGSSSDGEIVRSTVGLGHNLGLSIVAEGVEDESSLAFLREVGCDIAQGFFIAKPMPPESIADWATTSSWRIPVEA
jgi:diguanylate cyclase (GGDEF)-like protein